MMKCMMCSTVPASGRLFNVSSQVRAMLRSGVSQQSCEALLDSHKAAMSAFDVAHYWRQGQQPSNWGTSSMPSQEELLLESFTPRNEKVLSSVSTIALLGEFPHEIADILHIHKKTTLTFSVKSPIECLVQRYPTDNQRGICQTVQLDASPFIRPDAIAIYASQPYMDMLKRSDFLHVQPWLPGVAIVTLLDGKAFFGEKGRQNSEAFQKGGWLRM